MSSIEAAYHILETCGSPLHYKEITKRIMDQGLWHSSGKTPDATVNANLAMDIKEKGASSKFQRVAEGVYALRSWGLQEYTISTKQIHLEKAKPDKPIVVEKAASIPPTVKEGKPFTFNDAAEYVLEKFAQKQPMHYEKITEEILKLGLVHTQGQTPEATLYAQILTEIRKKLKRGETPRFVKHGSGMVGLQKWLGEGLSYQIQSHNESVRKKLHKKIFEMSPADFEALVGKLLVALGFTEVLVTSQSGDGGIDVRGTLVVGDVVKTKMAVQVKRWKNNVQAPVVQQVRGSLSTHEQGLIITTSDFSKGAYEEAKIQDKIPVALMNGEQFVALLIENDIGIVRTSYDLIDLADNHDENP